MKARTKDRLRRFAKLKFALREVQLLNFPLDPFLIETRLCPRSLAPTLVVIGQSGSDLLCPAAP